MVMRIFQGAIVVFWLGTMLWLFRTITSTDEEGMVSVDPRRPVKAFFNWNDNTAMAILNNGIKIGEARVAGLAATEEKRAGFSISGSLNGNVPAASVGTFAQLLLKFSDDFEVASGDFTFRIPSNNFGVKAKIEDKNQTLKAEVSLAGQRLFTYDGSTREAINSPMMGMVKNNVMADGMLSAVGDPAKLKWNLKSFRGMHRMAGRRIPVYLMKLSLDELDQEVSIYFSEAGEPLKLDSDFGLQVISEVLVPLRPSKR